MENTNTTEITNEVKTAKKRGRPKIHFDVPATLTCTVTGKTVKTTPLQFRRSLEKSGKSRSDFIETYVSREGRKLLRLAAKKAEKEKSPENTVA